MSSDKVMEIQQQVRQNSEELQDFLMDLGSWQKEMEAKDNQLKKAAADEGKKKETRSQSETTKKKAKLIEEVEKPAKPKSWDYSAWDKFDVDKALEEMDAEEESSGSENEDSEEDEHILMQRAVVEKDKGNDFFKKGDYIAAIDCYTRAIQFDPGNAVFPANRAMALIKNGQMGAAEADCTLAISLDPTYVKAFHRRANARVNLKRFNEAMTDFQKVLELEPKNKVAKVELDKLIQQMALTEKKEETVEKPKPENKSFEENLKKSFAKQQKDQTGTKKIEKLEIGSRREDLTTSKKVERLDFGFGQKDRTASKKLEKLEGGSTNETLKVFQDNEIEVVHPIDKKAHQRSKKPLNRIDIVDVEDDEPEIRINLQEMSANGSVANKIELVSSDSDANAVGITSEVETEENVANSLIQVEERKSQNCSKGLQKKIEDEILQSLSIQSQAVDENRGSEKFSKPPKSSVQFLCEWRQLKSDEERCRYLQLFRNPRQSYARIFKQSMEPAIFTDIVALLNGSTFKDVSSHLIGMSRVPRMSALVMFLNASDKKNLDSLIDKIKNDLSVDPAELKELQSVFS